MCVCVRGSGWDWVGVWGVRGCSKRSECSLHFSKRHVKKYLVYILYMQKAAVHQLVINTIQESWAWQKKRKSLKQLQEMRTSADNATTWKMCSAKKKKKQMEEKNKNWLTLGTAPCVVQPFLNTVVASLRGFFLFCFSQRGCKHPPSFSAQGAYFLFFYLLYIYFLRPASPLSLPCWEVKR